MTAPAAVAARSSKAAAAVAHLHPFPSFHTPSHPSPAEPWQFSHDQRYFKKPAASIGYACAAQLSDNMQLSLQWEREGRLRRWERERPFAVREQRQREQRRQRGEPEEAKATFDLFSAFPPIIRAVPAPTSFDLHQRHPLLPPQPRSAPSASSAPASTSSNSALRVRARRLLAEAGAYDPYAAALLPFFKPQPSHFTDTYHSTSPQLSTSKVSLLSHPLSSYARPPPAAYRGSNHRWTEERLFFRGYQVKPTDGAGDGEGGDGTAAAHPAKDLLFDAPLYSSFAPDGVYREPARKGLKKAVRWSQIPAPRIRHREESGGSGGLGREAEEKDGLDLGQASFVSLGEDAVALSSTSTATRVEGHLNASGVYVPRAASGRFISTHQYTANNRARGQ